MVEVYEKRGWAIKVISSKTAKKPSLLFTKEGQRQIVLHFTTIGGYERYYCMLFDESTKIPNHPFRTPHDPL